MQVKVRQAIRMRPCEKAGFLVTEIPYDEDVTWYHIKFKTFPELWAEYGSRVYFDAYGQLCLASLSSSERSVAETTRVLGGDYFCYLGQTVSVKKGHGLDDVRLHWLVDSITLKLPEEVSK